MTDTPTIDWPTEKVAELLGQVTLVRGHHDDGNQACAMDLIGMAIEGQWTDTPACVHPVLAQAVHRINDHPNTDAEGRLALVLEAGPHLIGTNDKTRTPWAVLVAYRGGLTTAGFVAALTATPPVENLAGADLTRANLAGADLSGAYLSGADLSGANLSGAYLSGAYLSGAYLSGAYLSGANLSGAYLSRAYLSRAYLSRANLSRADLSRADLTRANLSRANLSRADLSRADLTRANLTGADLSGANLSGADLSGADRLDEAYNVPAEALEAWKTAQAKAAQ